MPRKHLTLKQKSVAQEIAKGTNPLEAVLKTYQCNGKDPRASASVILNKLNSNVLFKEELSRQRTLVQEIIQREGQKLIDILEEIFPKVERARILVEIARTGDIKSKLEALKEINKIQGEYPQEDTRQIDLGGLHITMIPPAKEQERIRGQIIEERIPQLEEREDKTSHQEER